MSRYTLEQRQHWAQEASLTDISTVAGQANRSEATVRRWMSEFGLKGKTKQSAQSAAEAAVLSAMMPALSDHSGENEKELMAELLERAYTDTDKRVSETALVHPWLPRHLLESALQDANIYTRCRALGNPACTEEDLKNACIGDPWTRAASIANPNTSRDRLLQALDDSVGDVRLAAARHPNADRSVADKAFGDFRRDVCRSAVNNHHITPSLLAKALLQKNDPDLAYSAALNPALPSEAAASLIQNARSFSSQRLLNTLAHNSGLTGEHVGWLLQRTSEPDTHTALASHPNLRATDLEFVVSHFSASVRAAAAARLDLTAEQIQKLSHDKEPSVLEAIAAHPNLPQEDVRRIFYILKDDYEWEWVRPAAAKNPNLPAEQLDQALRHYESSIYQEAALNPNATEAQILEHVDNPYMMIVRRADTSEEALYNAMEHESRHIRSRAVEHDNAPVDLVERGMEDRSAHVRQSAVVRMLKIASDADGETTDY